MSQPEPTATPHPWSIAGDSARMLLRLHREQMLRYSDVPTLPARDAQNNRGDTLTPPRESRGELSLATVPVGLQRMVQEYERDHPGVRLAPRRFLVVGDGEHVQVGSETADLPGEDELVSLVITETALDAVRVRVRSQLLIAALVPQARG